MFNYIMLFMNLLLVLCKYNVICYNYTVDDLIVSVTDINDNSLDLNDLIVSVTDNTPKMLIDLVFHHVIDLVIYPVNDLVID